MIIHRPPSRSCMVVEWLRTLAFILPLIVIPLVTHAQRSQARHTHACRKCVGRMECCVTTSMLTDLPHTCVRLLFDCGCVCVMIISVGVWQTSSWGECSVSCGVGVQSRVVRCVSPMRTMRPVQCDPSTTPSSTQSCNTQPCSSGELLDVAWSVGEWSECNCSQLHTSRHRLNKWDAWQLILERCIRTRNAF